MTASTLSDLVTMLPLAVIDSCPLNPRRSFNDAGLAELAASIRSCGLIEPVVVRPNGARYELIVGERRLRAVRLNGATEIPVRVMDAIDDATALRMMLIENLQRQDLNAIEEARGYRALMDTAGMTQEEIAVVVGCSQPRISNMVRLLGLPDAVQEMIADGRLTGAHGVALARFSRYPDTALRIATLAVEHSTTSHDLERGIPFRQRLEAEGLLPEMTGRGYRKETQQRQRAMDRVAQRQRDETPRAISIMDMLVAGRRLGDMRRRELVQIAEEYEGRATFLRRIAAEIQDNRAVRVALTEADIERVKGVGR